MKIAFDIRNLNEKKFSGVNNYIYNTATSLMKIDKENEYFFYNNKKKYLNKKIIKLHNIKYIPNYPRPIWTNILLPIKLQRDKIDVLFTGKMETPIFFNNTFKSICTIFDCGIDKYPKTGKLIDYYYGRITKKISHKIADAIISISKNTAKDYIDIYQADPKKIYPIYLGVNNDIKKTFDINKFLKLKSKYQINKDYFLFVGNIHPRKNILNMIDAFDNIKNNNLQIIIVGKKAWKYEKIITKINEHKNVRYIGYISDEELSTLYSFAYAFIFPSINEGFGLPVLEAMKCGCPVICSNNSSMLEIVGGAALMFDPFCVKDIKAKINLIIQNEKIRKELVYRGYRRYKNFSWDKTAKNILKIINDIKH